MSNLSNRIEKLSDRDLVSELVKVAERFDPESLPYEVIYEAVSRMNSASVRESTRWYTES